MDSYIYSLADTTLVEGSSSVEVEANPVVIQKATAKAQVAFVRKKNILVTKLLENDQETSCMEFSEIQAVMHIPNTNLGADIDYLAVLAQPNIYLYNYLRGVIQKSAQIGFDDSSALIYPIPDIGTHFIVTQKGNELSFVSVSTLTVVVHLHIYYYIGNLYLIGG